MTFTPEEFDTLYTAYQNNRGFLCDKLEYCEHIGNCAKCPLYYMVSVEVFVFILNNTPDYPHDKIIYLETKNGIKKTAYYNEIFKSWEVKYE